MNSQARSTSRPSSNSGASLAFCSAKACDCLHQRSDAKYSTYEKLVKKALPQLGVWGAFLDIINIWDIVLRDYQDVDKTAFITGSTQNDIKSNRKVKKMWRECEFAPF